MAKEKEKPVGLALLREPFPENQISKLPKPTTKDGKKADCKECGGYHAHPAIHLDYVGHAALTDRLLDADPNWTWEPLALSEGLPAFDKTGGLWIKLTVCGITRLGYGHAQTSQYKEIGSREKEVIGDALRNAAMRFGAALDLWHKGELHVEPEADEKPKDQSKKEAKPKEENAKADGPPNCKTCDAQMLLAKSGKHWYCPNWQDGQEHNPIRVQKKAEESEEPEEKTVVTKTPEGFKSELHEPEQKRRGPGRPPKVKSEETQEPAKGQESQEDFEMFDEFKG